jgi:hypothetical protein
MAHQRRGQRRLSRSGRARERNCPAVHGNGARVKHEMPALVQQNAERHPEHENGGVTSVRARYNVDGDLAAARDQETGEIGGTEKILVPRCSSFQVIWQGPPAHENIVPARFKARHCARKRDFRSHRKS